MGQSGGKSGAKSVGVVAKSGGAEVPLCGSSEKESDVAAEMVGLSGSADPRWTGVVKLTNVSGHDCVVYGAADARTDHTSGEFTRLTTGVLGGGSFAADRAHGTVLRAGGAVFQPVTWLSSPPVAPNASCTTGSLLVLVRNEGVLSVSVPVKDARYCPAKESGSPQVLIGVPQPTLDQARAQLRNLGGK
ncbi:hypothetical protein ACFC1R_18075 [Kitasatospora sp. NPDC056138]|uniref:hypothetical protein n=1 Tax=Kitasatospora sp. NPDC056138 TaxID=3345724 RepID=UPI0035DDD137